ncbi:FAD-dependent oxidoreductase [Rubneribacter sp.]|nr:FAD-dependent oxidoreductase [Candidatus Rubneribacter avistercoris]
MSDQGNTVERPERSGLSRRAFVLGLGASAALAAGSSLAACAPQTSAGANAGSGSTANSADATSGAASADAPDTIQAAAEKPADKQETKDADLVVVGSGIAGMSAAVEASRAGAKVIVLEKHDVTGGDSSICSGNFYCCGSKKQDELGYTDYGTPEEIAQFYFDQSDGDANMDICRLVAENGGAAMDWLVEMGCDFDKKPEEGATDRSMLSTTGGKGLVDNLIAEAEKNGVELMMETRAVEVIMDGGAAAGVKARQGSTEYVINAKAVMLACGGFDGQDWSKELYAPGAVGWHTFSSPSNTGDGIELARQAGAMVLLKGGLSQIHLVGHEPLPLNDELSSLRMVNTGVFVTDLGYRCANESMTSQFDYFTPFVQSGRKKFFIICDSQLPEKRLELVKKGVEKGVVNTADTIEALAEEAGLPSYPLVKTVEKYNALCEAGEDADFHKKPEDLQALTQAPFYAIQITPNTNDSFGALAISTKAEVLDENRQPVPGLYAGGTLGNAELFYLRYAVSGASLCMGTVTGRIAAQSALEYAGL